MLKIGLICELDIPNGTARVHFQDDDVVSNWLPMVVQKSLKDKFYFPFDINEQVCCMMDETGESGVIVGAMFNNKDGVPNGSGEGVLKISLIGNSHVTFDRNTQTLTFDIAGNINIKSAKNVTVEAAQNANIKAMNATVEATAAAKVKGATITIDAPATIVTGTLAVSGGLTAASFGGAGGAAMDAPNGVNSAGTISGMAVKAMGKDLATHIHTSGATGSQTSPPL